jgi:hypothetical protein
MSGGFGVLVLVLLSGVAGVSASAHRTAGCGGNRIGVRGPTVNASNVFFNEMVFRCATGKGNYVTSGEQRTRSRGCAHTLFSGGGAQ